MNTKRETKKISMEQTEECPIHDQCDNVWIESDDQFRQRTTEQSDERGLHESE